VTTIVHDFAKVFFVKITDKIAQLWHAYADQTMLNAHNLQ
jgi:hypothetical protein